MKKPLSFTLLSLVTFLTLSFLAPKSALADGVLLRPDYYDDSWDYSIENNQQAFINYDSGMQKMIISIGFEEDADTGVVWIFPVPADPNKVAIDVVKSLPDFSYGEEISGKAKSNLEDIMRFLEVTQIYPIPYVMLFSEWNITGLDGTGKSYYGQSNGLISNFEQDVVVYDHLEKEGITSEIVTAKTSDGLYDYLKSKKLKIEKGSIPVLDDYIGKDYSFVVSWISSLKENISAEDVKNNLHIYFYNKHFYPEFFGLVNLLKEEYPEFNQAEDPYTYLKSEQGALVFQGLMQHIQDNPSIIKKDTNEHRKVDKQRGVFVTFPTDKIYFPLLPTSVYGSEIVPVTIRVIGHVTPVIFGDIKSYTDVEYYIDDHFTFSDALKSFYNEEDRGIKYTKVKINAPSKFFTDDLWLEAKAPIKTHYSTFVAKNPVIAAVVLFVLSSVLAGTFSGMVLFKNLRKRPLKLVLISLSNLLTLFGLLITTMFVSTKNKDESIEQVLVELKQKKYVLKRRFALILFSIVTPISTFIWLFFRLFGDVSVCGVLIPITVFVIALIIKKVKPEDKGLFEQLKSANYSSWSFQPKDGLKIVFVPLFSVSFLVTSWLLVKIVELKI